jgi:hypothetical protein
MFGRGNFWSGMDLEQTNSSAPDVFNPQDLILG